MIFTKTQRSHKIFIVVIILTIFVQLLQLSLEYESQRQGDDIEFMHVYADQRSNCWVATLEYFFEIPRCQQLEVGSIISVIGTHELASDSSFFGAKKLTVSSISLITNPGNSVKGWWLILQRRYALFRFGMISTLERYLEEPFAGIVSALLFGGRWRMSGETQSLFETIGIVHIAAASGFHLSIVLRFMGGIAGRLPRRMMAVFLLFVAVAYLGITGASPSMLRACVAVWLVVVGRHLWWRPIQPSYLFIAGVLFLIASSIQLLSSVAFQLSVAATAGIFVFSRPFLQNSALEQMFTSSVVGLSDSNDLSKWPVLTYLKDSLIVSFGAQLGVLPLLLYHFGSATLLGILATAVVSWLLPALFLSGWLTIGIAAATQLVWVVLPVWVLASVFVGLLNSVAMIVPNYHLQISLTALQVVCSYLLMAVIAIYLVRFTTVRRQYVRVMI